MAQQYEGEKRPAQLLVTVKDRDALKGQYIRHNDTGEIFKIFEIGREGVTAYQAEGFGAPVIPGGVEYLITWPSLKFKHRIMTHVADVEAPGHLKH